MQKWNLRNETTQDLQANYKQGKSIVGQISTGKRKIRFDIDDEVKLAQRIKEGDQGALKKMVNANLRFVVSVAKQYQNSGLALGDLINEGNVGLMKAAARFDETRGFKFISYAVWWIRQSIMQALAEHSRVVRIPLNRVGSLTKLNTTFSQLEQKFQREPSLDELSDVLAIDPGEIANTIRTGARQVSVNAPFAHGRKMAYLMC